MDIRFAFPTTATTDDVIAAVTTLDGVKAFWTNRGQGGAGLGQKMSLQFPGTDISYEFETTEATERSVKWRCLAGPANWVDTTITFAEGGPHPMGAPGHLIAFSHGPFAEDDPFVPFGGYVWAQILARLAAYLEEGTRDPYLAS